MTEDTTINSSGKPMKVDEEIKPTGDGARSERQEPGFTPGPWGDWRREDGSLFIGTRDHVYVCQMAGVERDPEVEANARLIAAAPALYEAAKEAARELSVMLALHPERDGGKYRQALNALDAALSLVDPQQQKR